VHHRCQVQISLGVVLVIDVGSSSLIKYFEVFMEHRDNVLYPKDRTQSFVLAQETESDESIPLCEVNWGRWVFRFDSNYAGLYLGRRLETISAHFNDVVHFG
jgi:hypothetical protein